MISEQPRPEPAPNPRSEWAGLVREHPGLLLTAGYLLLTIVGLSYELWFFRYFRINILEYVETSDFLLAALRTPRVIVLNLGPHPNGDREVLMPRHPPFGVRRLVEHRQLRGLRLAAKD